MRNHFLEARVQHELRRRDVPQHDGYDRAGDHHDQPMVEYEPLEQIARVLIEVRKLADDRHLVEIVGNGCHRVSY